MWWHYISNYQGADTYSSEAHGPRSLPKARNIGRFLAKSLYWIFLSSIIRISLYEWDASFSGFGSRISQASTFILGWKVGCGRKWPSSDKSDSTFGRAIAVTPRRANTCTEKICFSWRWKNPMRLCSWGLHSRFSFTCSDKYPSFSVARDADVNTIVLAGMVSAVFVKYYRGRFRFDRCLSNICQLWWQWWRVYIKT